MSTFERNQGMVLEGDRVIEYVHVDDGLPAGVDADVGRARSEAWLAKLKEYGFALPDPPKPAKMRCPLNESPPSAI